MKILITSKKVHKNLGYWYQCRKRFLKYIFRSSRYQVFCTLSVFRSFTKFIRKYLYQRVFLRKLHSSKLFVYALKVWGSKKIWLFQRFSFRWLHLLIEWWIFLIKPKEIYFVPFTNMFYCHSSGSFYKIEDVGVREGLFSLSYTSFCQLNLNK